MTQQQKLKTDTPSRKLITWNRNPFAYKLETDVYLKAIMISDLFVVVVVALQSKPIEGETENLQA